MGQVQYTTAIRSYQDLPACGDLGWVKKKDNKLFMALVDGAGHGSSAERIAKECYNYLEHYEGEYELPEMIQSLHNHVLGSIGLVIGLCLLDITTGELLYSGMGNISVKIFGKQSHTFVSRDGVVGFQITRPLLERFLLNDGDTVLMHSDGISQFFGKKDYPNIIIDDLDTVADTLVSRFGKEHDDVGCVVMRYSL